jgi:hypothetical protein
MTTKYWWKPIVQLSLALVFAGVQVSAAVAEEPAPNAPMGGSISPATTGTLPRIDSGYEQVRGGTAWQAAPVFTGGFTLGVVHGDGRGDGTIHLYATEITSNTLREFAYAGSWTNTSNISLPFYSEGALLLGDGRGDGGAHLYAGNFGGGAAEFTWDGATWTTVSMGSAGQQFIAAAQGDARGDGSPHLFFATGSAPPNNVAYEYTFNGTSFMSSPIPSPLSGTSDGTFGSAVGDGRNDAILRLYLGVFDAGPFQYHVYEFSWNGAGWEASQVANIGSGPAAQVMGVAVGDGRNEGANRLYVVVRGSEVREFIYDGSAWVQTANIPVGSELFNVVIGDGHGDGLNRLYIAQYTPSRVMEAEFDGATWQTALVGNVAGPVFRVDVGDARGDGLNRVYSSGSGGVYEFTHASADQCTPGEDCPIAGQICCPHAPGPGVPFTCSADPCFRGGGELCNPGDGCSTSGQVCCPHEPGPTPFTCDFGDCFR